MYLNNVPQNRYQADNIDRSIRISSRPEGILVLGLAETVNAG